MAIGPLKTGGVYVSLYEMTDVEVVNRLASEFGALRQRIGPPKVVLVAYTSKHLAPKTKLKEVSVQ